MDTDGRQAAAAVAPAIIIVGAIVVQSPPAKNAARAIGASIKKAGLSIAYAIASAIDSATSNGADEKKQSGEAVAEITDGLPNETDKRGRPVKGQHVNIDGDAQKDLNELPGEMGSNGQKTLPDGSTAGVHTSTTTGAQTLHIHRPPGSQDITIRYPEKKQ